MRGNLSGVRIRPALAFATGALVLCGITGRGQQSQAEIESRALVNKIVAALGGEAAVARVKSTRLKSTRHAKTADGDAVIAVDRIVDYPDRIWMLRKAPQFEATTVVTPADAFTVTAGIVRDLPAAMRQEAARAIKLGVLAIAQHAQDPAYSFAVKGEENVRGLGTAVLEIAVNGDKAIWNVDPSTGRVLRETRIAIGVAGKPSQTSFEYSDWRVVDGVSVPFRIAESGSTTMVDEVMSFEINPSFPPALFERPSAAAGGTPAALPRAATGPALESGAAQTRIGPHQLTETLQEFLSVSHFLDDLPTVCNGTRRERDKNRCKYLQEVRDGISNPLTHDDNHEYEWDFTKDGRLANVTITPHRWAVQQEDRTLIFQQEISFLTQAYGAPTSTKTTPYQNGFGATWNQSEVFWTRPDATIEAVECFEFSEQGHLCFIHITSFTIPLANARTEARYQSISIKNGRERSGYASPPDVRYSHSLLSLGAAPAGNAYQNRERGYGSNARSNGVRLGPGRTQSPNPLESLIILFPQN